MNITPLRNKWLLIGIRIIFTQKKTDKPYNKEKKTDLNFL